MITIFTPTYNRAYIIGELYKSLCAQTNRDFEWLIVDDGSNDNTKELIASFIAENKITIRYILQENGGKHRAINRGVQEAKGELFFIVDSDDHLSTDCISIIKNAFQSIQHDSSIAGISGTCCYPDGGKVGGETDVDNVVASFIDLRAKYHIKGDLAEVYRTSVLAEFPFPEIEGEKFCPEACVWYQIACKYKLLFINKNIYTRDYLPDGLSAKITKIRMQSPIATMMTYEMVYKSPTSMKRKIKAAINFWRFYFCSSVSLSKAIQQIGFLNLLFMPLGYYMHCKDLNAKLNE